MCTGAPSTTSVVTLPLAVARVTTEAAKDVFCHEHAYTSTVHCSNVADSALNGCHATGPPHHYCPAGGMGTVGSRLSNLFRVAKTMLPLAGSGDSELERYMEICD